MIRLLGLRGAQCSLDEMHKRSADRVNLQRRAAESFNTSTTSILSPWRLIHPLAAASAAFARFQQPKLWSTFPEQSVKLVESTSHSKTAPKLNSYHADLGRRN